MEQHEAKRVEIIIEAIMEKRLTGLLIEAGVTGFSVLPVKAGSGRSGHWRREGTIGRADGMSCIMASGTNWNEALPGLKKAQGTPS